jgi:hypothetical protein
MSASSLADFPHPAPPEWFHGGKRVGGSKGEEVNDRAKPEEALQKGRDVTSSQKSGLHYDEKVVEIVFEQFQKNINLIGVHLRDARNLLVGIPTSLPALSKAAIAAKKQPSMPRPTPPALRLNLPRRSACCGMALHMLRSATVRAWILTIPLPLLTRSKKI